ncbi:hypothetical protein CEP52_010675 [Fusarium oligoseptatum]|uniref:Uncharacterized protein n=1 Tax=Fusarium oligoseptatum TaxID=2604345 RepID=A0A428T775_9HYPO|nr:hypothetical protein CEP52_010675 [Fusarium oligoseptatum]
MTLKRSRSDVAKITPATANWRVPSSSVGAEIIGTGSSEDTESRSSPESRALLLRSLPVWSLNSSIGSDGGFGEMDRLDPTADDIECNLLLLHGVEADYIRWKEQPRPAFEASHLLGAVRINGQAERRLHQRSRPSSVSIL